ncbi:hypothetical protein [Celeribacter sp.]|uniref:hypothetical protein n=1 Tax=Celeribacter sp. TaxID=1890673 RepID=UPI003A91185B
MKHKLSFAVLATAAAFSFSGGPVAAQQVDIAAACFADAASCAALVQAQIAALEAAGLTGAELDAAIGQIAASVYSAAQATRNPAALSALSAALTTASASMSSPAAAAGLRQAAQVVASGQAATTQPTAFGLAPTTAPAPSTPPVNASGT